MQINSHGRRGREGERERRHTLFVVLGGSGGADGDGIEANELSIVIVHGIRRVK